MAAGPACPVDGFGNCRSRGCEAANLQPHPDHQRLEIANRRYDAAKENTAGAGRGKQGGPTANERSTAKNYAKGGKVLRVEAMQKRKMAETPSTRSKLAMKKGGKVSQW